MPFPSLSDSTAAERAYGPGNAPKIAIAPGIQWKGADDKWESLADAAVNDVTLRVDRTSPNDAKFELDYALNAAGDQHTIEQYTINDSGVEMTDRLTGGPAPSAMRLRLPALVSDGATDTTIQTTGDSAAILNQGSKLTYKVLAPSAGVTLKLDGPRIPSHNGYMQAITTDVPVGQPVRFHISLSQQSSPSAPK